ncbi:starch synthase [Candidatus Aerophobetes bacterium]|uniref:Starch synthase n=1 Tax=Aerophobetes bacterium TaxID=2030807 RepID=A0A2A4YCZ5_UNCAE|nr:MAG: starch synthase [Candidatus Aerophobetes bacterium]
MRILLTNTGPWGTGSFTCAHAILKELLLLGHDVQLFFPDAHVNSSDLDYYYKNPKHYHIWRFPLKDQTHNIESFPLMIPDPHPRSRTETTFKELDEDTLKFYFQEARKALIKVIKQFKPDIVECQHIWSLDSIIDEFGIPYVCTAHHSDQMGFMYDARMRPYALASAKHARKIFAISEFVKAEVMDLYHVDENKVVTITNGYSKKYFKREQIDKNAILEEFDINADKNAIFVSFAGKISKTKGVDTILEANRILDNPNIHFLILGSGELEKVIDSNRIEDYSFKNAHFLGHRHPREIVKIHNISKLSLMPSRSEGFGISALEAMACGLPLVYTDVGGIHEFAIGKCIKKEDPKALANAIESIITMPDADYSKLSNKSEEVAHTFSWKELAKKRVYYYKQALSA